MVPLSPILQKLDLAAADKAPVLATTSMVNVGTQRDPAPAPMRSRRVSEVSGSGVRWGRSACQDSANDWPVSGQRRCSSGSRPRGLRHGVAIVGCGARRVTLVVTFGPRNRVEIWTIEPGANRIILHREGLCGGRRVGGQGDQCLPGSWP